MLKRNRSNPTRHAARRAFTLVEILVVVTIIAILATMVTLRLFGVVGGARGKVATHEAAVVASALKLYLLDTGRSPEDGMDLGVLLLPPDDKDGGPGGPYLEKRDATVDPWGNPFYLRVPGEVNYDYDVVSYGKDGQPGGEGENADITQ